MPQEAPLQRAVGGPRRRTPISLRFARRGACRRRLSAASPEAPAQLKLWRPIARPSRRSRSGRPPRLLRPPAGARGPVLPEPASRTMRVIERLRGAPLRACEEANSVGAALDVGAARDLAEIQHSTNATAHRMNVDQRRWLLFRDRTCDGVFRLSRLPHRPGSRTHPDNPQGPAPPSRCSRIAAPATLSVFWRFVLIG